MNISGLKQNAHVHVIGICGTAMASLAGLLKDRGFKVTGSDSNPYPPMSTQIEALGIKILKPYSAKNLEPKPDFVIIGNVISKGNEEADKAIELGIPYTSLAKAMGEFIIGDKQSIVIAGTHGKTTTTSLMAWVATEVGVKPGFLIGGIAKNFSKSFQNPQGDFFVIEGDEYDTAFFDKVPKFIHYRPRHVILTSVEFDHADIYKDLDAVKAAFKRLMELTPENGTLIYCADDANVVELSKYCKAKTKIGYGIKNGDIRAQILKVKDSGTVFKLSGPHSTDTKVNGDSRQFQMNLTGEYNVLNAAAVIALTDALKWDAKKVKDAFKSFQGVKRRQEILGEPKGVLIIEDFAHHPTAVRETIKGIKAKYPKRKMFAVFEPRSATSRRKVFQNDYALAFQQADEVLIAKAFDQTKIDESNRFSSEELVTDIKRAGKQAGVYDNVDQIVNDVTRKSKAGDLVLVMSNGGFDGIYTKLLNALESKS
jgi:UDP-N-acetylmuramate: L-alanyl-gamma-D-glutamyl-meso-diaminopimelate ligase